MCLPMDFVVLGTPKSVQAASRSKTLWKAEVSTAAQTVWPLTRSPLTTTLKITVVYYYLGAPLDTDNMLKPIQDALNGVVYRDDSQITDITAGKRPFDGSFRVRGLSPQLAKGFTSNGEFVHVRIEDAPDPQELL